MVDELTQESFQTGKAIVTVSVDLITAIADACKRSEQQNPGMSEEQKETLFCPPDIIFSVLPVVCGWSYPSNTIFVVHLLSSFFSI